MQQTSSLDELAKSYIDALVTTLKNQGELSSPLIEDAFRSVPRHPFIEQFYLQDIVNHRIQWQPRELASMQNAETWLQEIYTNQSLITTYNEDNVPTSSSSSPDAMVIMLEALQLCPGLRVLEIGTGTGYNAALLAHIVGDTHEVFSVEIDAKMAQRAQHKLNHVVGEGVTVYAGNGLHGYLPGALYDRIIATGSYHKIPLAWLDQLQMGGIIVMNLRGHMGRCAFLKVEKVGAQRAAWGTFLKGSDFMELMDVNNSSHRVSELISRYLGRPALTQIPFSHAEFDPSLLWDHRLDFMLQLAFPHMYFTSVYLNPMLPCLVDVASDTMLVFHPTVQNDKWVVEIKGQQHVWDGVVQVYKLWVEAEHPDVTDYFIDIDDAGKQDAVLLSKERNHKYGWTIL
jgi:protein-L-isoaspartate(D-aspartate) O-methyltransferase